MLLVSHLVKLCLVTLPVPSPPNPRHHVRQFALPTDSLPDALCVILKTLMSLLARKTQCAAGFGRQRGCSLVPRVRQHVVPRVATTPNAAAQIRIGTRGTKLALYQAEQVMGPCVACELLNLGSRTTRVCRWRGRRPSIFRDTHLHVAKKLLIWVRQVREKLMHTNDECLHTAMSVEVIETHGDLDRLTPLRKLGSGAFTVLIDQAVADEEVDIGVHSLKDSPVLFPEGVVLACCLPREDPRDAFISPKAKSLGKA